jgi:hypothetical protein
MSRTEVDLHIQGTEGFAAYDGPHLVLYVIHDRTTPESLHELRHQLIPQLTPVGRFDMFRLKSRDDPNGGWSS